MRRIIFSHVYDKMPRGFEASTLLEVFVVDRDDLSEGFIEYDTAYSTEGRNYPLPKGKLVVLLLQARDSKELWATVRRCYKSKLDYYRELRGQYVECMVSE